MGEPDAFSFSQAGASQAFDFSAITESQLGTQVDFSFLDTDFGATQPGDAWADDVGASQVCGIRAEAGSRCKSPTPPPPPPLTPPAARRLRRCPRFSPPRATPPWAWMPR